MDFPFAYRQRVRFGETDLQGVVYYANYLLFAEVGRIAYLRELGVTGDLRVRHHGDRRGGGGGGARIEVEPRWVPWVTERLTAVRERLTALGFAAVEVDPRGYRRGSLLAERAERA